MTRRAAGKRPRSESERGAVRTDARPPGAHRSRRLPRAEREQQIVQGAITFFASVGLSGDTRELARSLHISHPLLYRYFGSKKALLERVYQEVYMRRWNPTWEASIKDRSSPLRARMSAVYNDYARAILSHEWVRIFLFSGLRDAMVHRRILDALRERIFVPICGELRHELGLPGLEEVPPTEDEIELIWGSHSRIFYYGVRKWVYHAPVPDDVSHLIELDLDAFFAGAPAVIRARLAPPGGAGSKAAG